MIQHTREAIVCLLDGKRALKEATKVARAEALLARNALDLVEQALEFLYLADDSLLEGVGRPKYRLPLDGTRME